MFTAENKLKLVHRVYLNSLASESAKTKNKASSITTDQCENLHIAVVVEDLRFPLDEGAKKASSSLICSIIKNGTKVSIFTRYGYPLVESVSKLPDNKFLFGHSFAQNLRTHAVDAILYIPISSGTIGAFIRAALIKKQSHGVPLALMNLQYRSLPRYARYFNLHRYADVVFTQSDASKEEFRSFRIRTVSFPGGVDGTIFQPVNHQEKRKLRLQYDFKDTEQILLHVGHCTPNRNVIILSRLVELGYRVIMITSTSTIIDKDLLIKLRQSGVIVITDFIENIQHYYQIADCYLFPVFHATSAIDAPLSVLEAMACNIPVVTTRFGALPRMFQPMNGFFYADTEEEIIRNVIFALDEHDCRTSEMVSKYSWDNVATIIVNTLRKISYP